MSEINSIKKVMAETFQINESEIPDEAELGKVNGWDSLGHVNFLMALGKEMGFEINPGTLTELTSIPNILNYINNSK